MEANDKQTVPADKPKREHKWTEKRREAFERCKKARQDQLKKMTDLKQQGKEKKITEAKRIRDLVKNTTKLKAILELIEGEEPSEETKAPKRPRSESPPPEREEPKKKKIVETPVPKKVAPPPAESESEEEPEVVQYSKRPAKPASPKQILYYKPKPKPKVAPQVQEQVKPPMTPQQRTFEPAPTAAKAPSLVFL
jgi:hypothetical protein